MTCEIPLTRGFVALVDDNDYDAVVAAGPWQVTVGGKRNTNYAVHAYHIGRGRNGKHRYGSISMHRFLTGWPMTDHANRNGLDNRRANLRPATHAENMRNMGPRQNAAYKGVTRNYRGWQARVSRDGVRLSLGTFPTPEEAAAAYDEAARELHGEFAWLNFPDAPTLPAS